MSSEFEKYKAEAKERWGSTEAYSEYSEKTKDYTAEKWSNVAEGLDAIMKDFSLSMKEDNTPDGEEAQSLVKALQEYITKTSYTCTKEILNGLGQMYVCDERFKSNIDKHGEGTAEFISKAIAIYCKR